MPNCPACGKGGQSLAVRCDACGCCFCRDGNCKGTMGGLKMSGSGRSPGTTCKCCGKGKLQKF